MPADELCGCECTFEADRAPAVTRIEFLLLAGERRPLYFSELVVYLRLIVPLWRLHCLIFLKASVLAAAGSVANNQHDEQKPHHHSRRDICDCRRAFGDIFLLAHPEGLVGRRGAGCGNLRAALRKAGSPVAIG